MVSRLSAVLIVLMMAVCPLSVCGSDAADQMTVTDGYGNTIVLDGPAEHVITIGVGVTATVIGVGALDKIVVCDSYSRTNSDEIFDDLKILVNEGSVAAGGNIYSSGKEQLKIDIIDAADDETGIFDKKKDVVMAVVSPSYKANLDFLTSYGFENVMYWNTVSSYDDIIDFVKTISVVCTGSVQESAEQMQLVADVIFKEMTRTGTQKAEAFYVTYSAGVFKVGNTGSVTTAMIEAAGGDVITKDDSRKESTYETSLVALMEAHPDAVIFADNTVASNQEYMNALRTQVGSGVLIVHLKAIWNNFSIESSDGVWTMACAMHPDLFEGDVPVPSENKESILTYVSASLIFIIIIIAVSYAFMRPGSRKRKV